jgi:hypothetical protein
MKTGLYLNIVSVLPGHKVADGAHAGGGEKGQSFCVPHAYFHKK